MGFFNKKKTIDLDSLFKEQYKILNQIMQSAQEELDFEIKAASYQLVIEKYDELLDLIQQGANFEYDRFNSMRQATQKELDLIKGL